MSDYDNGFKRAQQMYDNQSPPDDEPECNGCKYDHIKDDSPEDWAERIPCCWCSRSGAMVACPICKAHGMTTTDHFEGE